MKYKFNRVEGFDPCDFLETATDKSGNPIKKNGKEIRYLPNYVKKQWFRMVCPEGQIIEHPNRVYIGDNDYIYGYTTYIKDNNNNIIAEASAKSLVKATGLALSDAGFGIEIERKMSLLIEGSWEEKGENENE